MRYLRPLSASPVIRTVDLLTRVGGQGMLLRVEIGGDYPFTYISCTGPPLCDRLDNEGYAYVYKGSSWEQAREGKR